MKKSKFIDQFDTEFNEMIPDNKNKIKARLGILEEEPTKKPALFFNKPLIAIPLLVVMIVCISLFIPGKENKISINVDHMGSVIKTKEDVYAYSALSTSTLLSKNLSSTQNLSSKITDEELNKINTYIDMFDSLISDKGFKQETIPNEDKDYSQYETKMTVSIGEDSYISYYNETPLNEEDKDEDPDDDEIETHIEGIMLLNKDTSYKIVGTKEIEEDELEIKMMSIIDDNNYVKVEQEIENGEQEFVYEVKKNGGTPEHSKIEIEQEDDKELGIKLQFGKNEENAEIYEFTKKIDGKKEYLKIEVYQGEDNLIEVITVKTIIKEDGTKVNEYSFEDGSKKEIDD